MKYILLRFNGRRCIDAYIQSKSRRYMRSRYFCRAGAGRNYKLRELHLHDMLLLKLVNRTYIQYNKKLLFSPSYRGVRAYDLLP